METDVATRDQAFELVRRSFRDELALVEHRDPVGELVSLFEILRRQEDRHAVGDEVADDLPHGVAAAGVQTRGRFVEEDDARVADQGHRQIESPSHPAGVGGEWFSRSVDQIELLEQFGDAPATLGFTEVAQVRHERQVLLAGKQAVDGRELTGNADHGAYQVGIAVQIVATDLRLAAVGAEQGGQDLHRGGLARAVGPEQGEYRSLVNTQVDAIEHDLLAV